ncbi:hypothetical protein AGR5A_Lc70123 [Agrobacterium genomosp. 5 str. CFBP 6626]|nr:hypothetical protein AGR5A_Lc70123 [Agrobacterium genomosp. 5 str. CFBP 6626]
MADDFRISMCVFTLFDLADQFPCIAKGGVYFLHPFCDRRPVTCSEIGKAGCDRTDLVAETTVRIVVHGEPGDWKVGDFRLHIILPIRLLF